MNMSSKGIYNGFLEKEPSPLVTSSELQIFENIYYSKQKCAFGFFMINNSVLC